MNKESISTKTLDEIVTFIGNKKEEKKPMDIHTPILNPPSTEDPSTTPPTNVNNQEQLEKEFWSLVHKRASKSEFDDLFKKKGWDPNSNIKGFYNKYLSWGPPNGEKKKNDENKYNYNEGFKKIQKIKLQSCNDINALTQLVKQELEIP